MHVLLQPFTFWIHVVFHQVFMINIPGLVLDQNGGFTFSSIPILHVKIEHLGQNTMLFNYWVFSTQDQQQHFPANTGIQCKTTNQPKGGIVARDCYSVRSPMGVPWLSISTFSLFGWIFCGDLINEHSVGLSLGNKNLIWEFWFSCSGTRALNKQISMWRSSGTWNNSKTLWHASRSNLRSGSQQNSVCR